MFFQFIRFGIYYFRILGNLIFCRCDGDELNKGAQEVCDGVSIKRSIAEVSGLQPCADSKKQKFKHAQNEDKIKELSHKKFAEQSKKRFVEQ